MPRCRFQEPAGSESGLPLGDPRRHDHLLLPLPRTPIPFVPVQIASDFTDAIYELGESERRRLGSSRLGSSSIPTKGSISEKPVAVANHGGAGQGICNAGVSCVLSAAQGAPPRGANRSSMGEHAQNRQLGAHLYWLRGIVPLNYPLTPLTL